MFNRIVHLHKVIFEVIDEICDVFEADAFHAGMDEVFDIGNDNAQDVRGRIKLNCLQDKSG